jgi:organic hydroperoxide reductase OsmC/OhrA
MAARRTLMYTYETKIVWKREKEGVIGARANPALRVATPPEFGGPTDAWSPLELFVASIGSCYMSTFLTLAGKRNISVRTFEVDAKGNVDSTPDGLRFKNVDVTISATVDDEIMVKKVLATRETIHRLCPVAGGLDFPVGLEMNVTVAK